jgi:hypothetical protein
LLRRSAKSNGIQTLMILPPMFSYVVIYRPIHVEDDFCQTDNNQDKLLTALSSFITIPIKYLDRNFSLLIRFYGFI